jgi:hypothetical protein
MIYSYLFYVVLQIQCPFTKVINESNEEWNMTDKKALDRARSVCATDERYTDTPCLVKFFKREPMTYAALCGKALDRKG